MYLLNHRSSIGCEVDQSCVTEAIPQVIVLYSRQVSTKESDIDGEEEVRRSADVYVKAVEAIVV